MKEELVSETADLFAAKGQYQNARKLYMIRLQYSRDNRVKLLESLQGMAYISYASGDYETAERLLNRMLEEVEQMNNIPWKYKIYNNCGACFYMEKEYGKAAKVFHNCQEK